MAGPQDDDALPNPLGKLPALWGAPDGDEAWSCDLVERAAEFGIRAERVRKVVGSQPPRRFLVCKRASVTRWSAVYVAIDRALDRHVVLKISLRRDEPEPRLLASLQHPHIVAIHDVQSIDGYMTTVLEWCSRGNLFDYSELIGWRELIDLCIQAGQALDYCHKHERKIIHGDVKPSNVLVSDGGAKLIDFGFSRSATRFGDGSGTVGYIPPERAQGVWSPAGDVYSLALTVRALLRYHPDYERVPKSVLRVLRRGQADEPEERPTMLELLAGLREASDEGSDLSRDEVARMRERAERERSVAANSRALRWRFASVVAMSALAVLTLTSGYVTATQRTEMAERESKPSIERAIALAKGGAPEAALDEFRRAQKDHRIEATAALELAAVLLDVARSSTGDERIRSASAAHLVATTAMWWAHQRAEPTTKSRAKDLRNEALSYRN